MSKVKLNAYISKELKQKFYKKVFKIHGKTSGGAISTEVEKALEEYCE